MKKPRLGVNIDHVATVRNARGEKYPDPLRAALFVEKCGAHSVTIHLREDRRHIRDYDLKNIKEKLRIPLNLEMAPTKPMLNIAIKYKPRFVCIVPEKRTEVTTEGGLNLKKNIRRLKNIIIKLKKRKIRVSLFIEPKSSDIKLSKNLGVDCVELHVGKFCRLINSKKPSKSTYLKLKKSAFFAKKIGLEVHAGHGLTYKSAYLVSKINCISELNIGHFIVAESLFIGLHNSIKKFKKILGY